MGVVTPETKEEAESLVEILSLQGNPLHARFKRHLEEFEDRYADQDEWAEMVRVLRDLTLF